MKTTGAATAWDRCKASVIPNIIENKKQKNAGAISIGKAPILF